MTAASPCNIGASVVLPDGLFFGGTTRAVVGAVGAVVGAGVLATQVRQSLDSFMSSGQTHEVVGFVWLILIVLYSYLVGDCVGVYVGYGDDLGAGRHRWEQCPLKG